MKRLRKQHVLEQSIYGAIWIVIFLLPLIGGYFAMSGGLEREETRMVIRESWLSILPFFVLFLLNNYGLVPYFLFKKRYWQYTVSLPNRMNIVVSPTIPFTVPSEAIPTEISMSPPYPS